MKQKRIKNKTFFIKLLSLFLISILLTVCSCKKNENNPLNKRETVTISIPTANCSICEENIKQAIYKVEGVKKVRIDMEKKIATVTFVPLQTNLETIEIAITEAGYDANQRKRNPDAYERLVNCCK